MTGETLDGPMSRRAIDVAIGILVGLRGCSERQAFNEIAAAVAKTGIGLGRICQALVALASGTTNSGNCSAEVLDVWGDLIASRADRSETAIAPDRSG